MKHKDTLSTILADIQRTIRTLYKKSKQVPGLIWAAGAVLAVVLVTISLLVSGHKSVMADGQGVLILKAPQGEFTQGRLLSQQELASMQVPIDLNDGIPITQERGQPLPGQAISKNPEVMLTQQQADFVKNFGSYLQAHNLWAVVTSGTRSSENQLDIIKERIDQRGVDNRFPKLQEASLADTSVWLRAWQWLRGRHVPVNAPAIVSGVNVRISKHLNGLAIDFISGSLDQLRGWVANYARSSWASKTEMRVAAIVREPGCVHINLTPA